LSPRTLGHMMAQRRASLDFTGHLSTLLRVLIQPFLRSNVDFLSVLQTATVIFTEFEFRAARDRGDSSAVALRELGRIERTLQPCSFSPGCRASSCAAVSMRDSIKARHATRSPGLPTADGRLAFSDESTLYRGHWWVARRRVG
jgi:hypothetical protein